ncbi:MAG: hypothetical protein JWM50_359 [Microbacteriaceae bacterium]|jgi:hypothetical protein|nr:hypothetical protein [Microbacteriaceae bacterium]
MARRATRRPPCRPERLPHLAGQLALVVSFLRDRAETAKQRVHDEFAPGISRHRVEHARPAPVRPAADHPLAGSLSGVHNADPGRRQPPRMRRRSDGRLQPAPCATLPRAPVWVHSSLSVARGPPSPLLRGGMQLLRREVSPSRAARRSGRPAEGRGRGERGAHQVGETVEGGLAITQLGSLLRDGHRDGARNGTPTEPGEDEGSLLIAERGRLDHAPCELHAAVGGVDVLSARPGRARELPPQLRGGENEAGRHLEIHEARVARIHDRRTCQALIGRSSSSRLPLAAVSASVDSSG